MEERKEKILKIRKKIKDYNKFISEYGFNQEKDIFINEGLDEILKDLDKLEKEINSEK